MIETQSSIVDWADTTLGKVTNYASCITRAMKEMAELAMCIANDPSDPKAVEEAADVVICLTRLGEHLGVDIVEGARAKRLEWAIQTEGTWAKAAAVDLALLWESFALPLDEDALEASRDMLLDVVACLDGFIASRGKEMRQAIQEKMTINRARTWRLDGHGHGYHVKSQALDTAMIRAARALKFQDHLEDK